MEVSHCEPSVKVRVGDTSWEVLENYRDFLLHKLVPVLNRDAERALRAVVKRNRVRAVARIELPDEKVVYVKHYKIHRLIDRLRFSIAPSYARREWRALRAAKAKGQDILVPRPIAVADRRVAGIVCESWLILEAVPDAVGLNDVLLQRRPSGAERGHLLDQLSELTSRVAAAGIYHPDYHAGNVLVCRARERQCLALVDMHNARVGRKCSWRQFYRMLARMWTSLERLPTTEEERYEFVRNAFPAGPKRERSVRGAHRTVQRLTLRHWASNTARCIKENEWFAQGRLRNGRYSVLREFGLERLKALGDKHKNYAHDSTAIMLKDGSRGRVIAFRDENELAFCVKEVRSRGLRKCLKVLFGQSPGRRAWIAVNGLAAMGIPSPRSFGYLCQRTGLLQRTEYVVTEFIKEGIPLHQYVETRSYREGSSGDRRRFVRELAQYVARLHECGVYQHDLKADNVLVRKLPTGAREFYLVDWDAVRFRRKISARRRISNLTQLAAGMPNSVSFTQRLRFLRTYTDVAETSWNERVVIPKVVLGARARNSRWRI